MLEMARLWKALKEVKGELSNKDPTTLSVQDEPLMYEGKKVCHKYFFPNKVWTNHFFFKEI